MKWLLCCVLVVLSGCNSTNRSGDGPPAETPWGRTSAGLRMAVWTTPSDTERAAAPQVHVGVENVGESDVILNLGFMLGNGDKMYPLAVGLVLTDTHGKVQQLEYPTPGVGGRVDDFLVALRAGSMYSLRLALNEYWVPKEPRLTFGRGTYRIEARFTGGAARQINLDTEGIATLNFWKGTLQSNVATFALR